jgi:ribonucleoside-diphosphate reductase beta chain
MDSQKLIKELVAFYIIFKGVFFYIQFIQMLAMEQNNKMVGTSLQFKQILRDRYAHIAFGVDVINQIKLDNPALWAPDFRAELADMIHRAVLMEIRTLYCTPSQTAFGKDADKLAEHLKSKVNQYCVQIGLPERYSQASNQFSWMI